MDITELEYFKIIAETGSLTKAAKQLHVTQHLIHTTNFLATISTLSMDLRNDGAHRVLIPMTDPELNALYYLSYLKTNREKVKSFLQWGKIFQEEPVVSAA